MDAVKNGRIEEAKRFSDQLDAHLYRNANQSASASAIVSRRLADINVASLELQGLIKAAEKKYPEAIVLLETAWEKEHSLGYSEPPSYARPVLISLAEVHQQAGDLDSAVTTYEKLLKKRPGTANGLWGLYKVYKQKGDTVKAAEYARKLNDAIAQGDKRLYPL